MNRSRRTRYALSLPIVVLMAPMLAAEAALPRGNAEATLYRAYYLEHAAKDYAAARALYVDVRSGDADAATKRAARIGAARCRDQLATRNFAALMPPETLAYFELNRPGEIIEKLAEMLGLTCDDMREVLAQRPSADSPAMIHIPDAFKISPALFEALAGFGGAAVAITEFDLEHNGPPSGVLVLHHGDVKMLKGLIETAFQITSTAEKIDNLPTFGYAVPQVGTITGVLTESLAIVGTRRDLVEGVVGRLKRPETPSLASRKDLAEAFGNRYGATFFAYGNLHGVFERLKAHIDEDDKAEFDMINAIADLDHLRWATVSMGIDEGSLGARLAVRFADDHRSIAYNLMRLPPMSQDCLKLVPPNAAGFVGIGLNPALAQMAANAAEQQTDAEPVVTGFDIPREFFGNIREICAFAIPGKTKRLEGDADIDFIPNVGILFAVNNAAKSKALWNQILTLPGLVGENEPVKPKQVKIGKTPVMAYAMPEIGRVYMAELDGCMAFGLTRSAMKATIRAHNKQKSILNDDVMGKAIARMPTDSSLMFAVHVGRALEVAGGTGDREMASFAGILGRFCNKTVAWFGLGQAPNEFSIEGAVSGLPDLNAVLKEFSPMLKAMAGMIPGPRAVQTSIEVRDPEVTAIEYDPKPEAPVSNR